MPMVQYWKHQEKVEAKLTKDKNGVMVMQMKGEKEVFPGYPRGHILFGKLSKLKHEIKNQIFNDSWWMLEEGESDEVVTARIKRRIPEIYTILESYKYDIVPPEYLYPPVREIYRAWTKVAKGKLSYILRDMLCHVIQEDDSYRMRVQDMAEYFDPNTWWRKVSRLVTRKPYGESIAKDFERALTFIEHCEVIGDMKERQRLLRRILLCLIKDKRIGELFEKLCNEINWKKVYLTKADRYFFRGKYYKVDYRLFDY